MNGKLFISYSIFSRTYVGHLGQTFLLCQKEKKPTEFPITGKWLNRLIMI